MNPDDLQTGNSRCREAQLALVALHDEALAKWPGIDRWVLAGRHPVGAQVNKNRTLVQAREWLLEQLDEKFHPHLATTELAVLLGLTNHSSVVLMRQRIKQRKFSQPVAQPVPSPIV